MKEKIIYLIIFLFISISSIFGHFWINKKEVSPEDKKLEIKEEYQSVSNQSDADQIVKDYQIYFNNTDIIGELEISDIGLKAPVLHTSDNDYYLNHLIDKSYNTLGSIFLDYRNKVDDRKIIIYGHSSEHVYTEFNVLENYVNQDYYEKHPDIYFRTLDNYYHYKIFSVYVAIADYRYINLNFDDEEGYARHLEYLTNQSIYDTGEVVEDSDEIIVLQTCYYEPKGSYLIIVGRKVDI